MEWSLFNAFTDVHKLVLKEKPFFPRGRFFSLWINPKTDFQTGGQDLQD